MPIQEQGFQSTIVLPAQVVAAAGEPAAPAADDSAEACDDRVLRFRITEATALADLLAGIAAAAPADSAGDARPSAEAWPAVDPPSDRGAPGWPDATPAAAEAGGIAAEWTPAPAGGFAGGDGLATAPFEPAPFEPAAAAADVGDAAASLGGALLVGAGIDTRFAGVALHGDADTFDASPHAGEPHAGEEAIDVPAVQAPPPIDLGAPTETRHRLAALISEQRLLVTRMAEVSARLQLRNRLESDWPDPALEPPPADASGLPTLDELPPADAIEATDDALPGLAAAMADDLPAAHASGAPPPLDQPLAPPSRPSLPDPATAALAHAIAVAGGVVQAGQAPAAAGMPPPLPGAQAMIALPATAPAPPDTPRRWPAFAAGVALSALVGAALYAALVLTA